jgi:hypothetical protein
MSESPPYERQGEPLDASLGINGEWVIYAYIFLFLPPPHQKLTQLKLPTGENCFGFNAHDLAGAFNMDAATLLLNNRIKSVGVRWEPGIPALGAARCINFIFYMGPFGQVSAPVQVAPMGHA